MNRHATFFAMPNWKSLVKTSAIAIAIIYCLAIPLLYFNQRALIFAGAMEQGARDAQFEPSAGLEIVSLTTPKLKIPIKALYGVALDRAGISRLWTIGWQAV